MAGSSFGTLFRVTTFGESHGKAVGAIVDGCPPGITMHESLLQRELDRRRPGQSAVTTPRKESDTVEILSGIFEGKTTGAPICALVNNHNTDPSAYESFRNSFRPGHADYTFWKKYGIRDWRGGGRSSGRETIGRVIGGAIAKEILHTHKVSIIGHTTQIGNIIANTFDPASIEQNAVRCADPEAARSMTELVLKIREQEDSIGGKIELRITGCPVGLGEPVFDKISADLAKALFSIGTIKGMEIGEGFSVVTKRGSENNDAFTTTGEGTIGTATNYAGGMLGGISNGEPILIRLAVKPPASIARQQKTVDKQGNATHIQVHGRHDPCLCPRVIPVAESMVALVLVDHLLRATAITKEGKAF